jgi:heme/copper-type cytochrome/quinol oxidase subunit 2
MYTRISISRALTLAVCFAVLFGTASVASACPSCQQALQDDASQGDLARGLYYSILFMMSMPFAIIGTFGGLAYRAVKREQRRQAEAEQARNRSENQAD